MRFPVPTLGVLLLSGLLAACDSTTGTTDGKTATTAGADASSSSSDDIGDVLATVDGIKIGSKEFEEDASRRTPESGDALSMDEKKDVMDRLVEEKLLYKAALAKGLDKDPKVQKVMVNTLLRDVVYANVRNADFTDQELESYYEAHKDDFVVPEKVQVKRILIKVKDDLPDDKAKAQADQIRAQLVKNPDSFKDLAAKFSEDPYRRRGGDVGFVAKTGKPGLDQAVIDKAFTMNVGEISPVFKGEDGYNIIEVANKRERVERTFQQMKGSVLRKVKNDKLKELYEQYVDSLKNGAKIDIDQAKLTAVDVSPAHRPMMPGLSLGEAPSPHIVAAPKGAEGDDEADKGGDEEGGDQ